MPAIKFDVQFRFINFLERLKLLQISVSKFTIYSLGWLLFFFGLLYAAHANTLLRLTLLGVCCYFLFKLLDEINEQVKPPTEILIIFFLLIYFIDFLWIKFNFLVVQPFSASPSLPGFLPTFFQIFFLSFLSFMFSLILVNEKKKGRGTIISLIIAGIIAGFISHSSNIYFWWIFQFFLVLYLLKKINWTEELTQAECWIYIGAVILIIRTIINFPINRIGANYQYLTWNFLPYIIYQFFKLYLLTLLIKLPLVLVFHHARLSRKFRIAGLFQSSFPQLIQLIMLLLIFYFFVAGWQADNVSKVLENEFENFISNSNLSESKIICINLDSSGNTINIPNNKPINSPFNLPNSGIFKIYREENAEFFVFQYREIDSTRNIYLLPVNQDLLSKLGNNMQLLAGTHIAGYPFQFNKWDSLFTKIRGWHRKSQLSSFNIFPFGLISSNSEEKISAQIPLVNEENNTTKFKIGSLGQKSITIGRLFSPLYDRNFQRIGYWAFDIEFMISSAIINSTLMRNIIFWTIVYLTINFFVIKQVIKVGNKINQTIIQRFNQLKMGIRQISEGNLQYKINLEGEDEFVEVANRFNQMGQELEKTIEEVREKDRLKYELKIAHDVQLSLLPRNLPSVPGFNISAAMRAANEVGGDFYDLIPISKNRFLFVIGDVSGKGASAAFYMAQCMSLIRFSSQFSDDPKEIAIKLNKYFAIHTEEKQIFVTATIGIIDIKKGNIEIIRAGHTSPLLLSGSKEKPVTELHLAGIGIGLDRNQNIFNKLLKKQYIKMTEGDTLILCTDGLVEATTFITENTFEEEKLEFYGETRLQNLLIQKRGESSLQILNTVIKDLENFYGDTPKIDDFTLLVIQKKA